MRSYFTADCLGITVSRRADGGLNLEISSDTGLCHKSQLYVNEKRLAEEVERLWKSVKTKKLLNLSVGYSEEDYYDNMTNIYTTPSVNIGRGLKRARIFESQHGCIPKDWSFNLYATLADTTTNTPILEVLKKALGYLFTPAIEKEFIKKLRLVLQKKEKQADYYNNQYTD
jgi:hypothetical protein